MPLPPNHPFVDHPGALPRAVDRALRAMRAAPGRALKVADLARLAGVSARTLQRQFQAFLGERPTVALRRIRLECARNDLLQGPAAIAVADIALRCGFTHLGRFSAAYQRRYGEKPSETLQRGALLARAQSRGRPSLALARNRPSIAVLPVTARDGDQVLALAVCDELATALMRAGVTVVDRADKAAYRLHARCHAHGTQVRFVFHLVEAATARLIWAHDHDATIHDLFQFEQRLAVRLSAALQPTLRAAEIERAWLKPDADLIAHDLALRALPHVLALDAEGHQKALDLLERAIDRDPEHALAIALAASCHAQRAVYQFAANPAQERVRALNLVATAIRLGGDATTLAILGHALTSAHDLTNAERVTHRALTLDGASPWAWGRSGWIDVFHGRADSAIDRFAISLELAPDDPLAFNNFVGLAAAHFHAGRYAQSACWNERALAVRPSAGWVHRALCSSYVFLGRTADAGRSLALLRRQYPDATASQCAAAAPLMRSDRDRMAEALESAGLNP
jgi:AraC-like DNA-binding protein